MKTLLAVLVLSVFAGHAEATVLCTSGDGDAVAYNDWYGGGDFRGVFQNVSALLISEDASTTNTFWNQAVFEFPVSELAGRRDLQATLHLYVSFSQWDPSPSLSRAQLRYCGPGTGVVQYRDYPTFGQTVALFDCNSPGWLSFDVSSAIQDAVDSGYSHAVFSPYAANSESAFFGASESIQFAPYIVAVPEPGVVCGLSTLGLLLARRRMREIR